MWVAENLIDILPGTITRNGVKYRLMITKSTKGAYSLFYKPMHGGAKPLIAITDRTFYGVLDRAIEKLNEELCHK